MNVFDLQAKIGIDSKEFKEGIKNAGEMMKSLGSGVKNIASGIATGIGNMAKITAAGVTAASAGIAAIGKQAVESYAEYEQLVGGVETLFKDSAGKVQEYAKNAYKTAGMSANEYMETVTSFSASLLQSLNGDTNAAAEKANMAITDMSDNANKMGTSMEAIQNAYNGFAKQNYTMLDNLKLGYGGTGAEMERLMLDAEKLDSSFRATRDENGKLTMSYAEIVDAIHIVQTNMDITGTTAKEAATTIAGSISMAKASWENLITGVADDSQDFDALVNNFVDSVDTVASNILPRVEVALQGVGKLVEKLVPQILNRIPALLKNTLPALLQSAINLLKSIGSSLVENAGVLLASVRDLIFEVSSQIKNDTSMGEGFVELFKSVSHYVPQIIEFMVRLGEKMISAIADSVNENGGTILDMLLEGIEKSLKKINEFGRKLGQSIIDILSRIDISEGAKDIINTLIAGLGVGIELIAGIGMQIIRILADTFTENSESIFNTISYMMQEILVDIADYLPDLIEMAFTIIKAIGEGILENAPYLIDTAIWLVESFGEYLSKNAPKMITELVELVAKIAEMLTNPDTISRLVDVAIVILNTLVDALIEAIPILLESAPVIIENLVKAITDNLPKIIDSAIELIDVLLQALLENIPLLLESGIEIINALIDGVMEMLPMLLEKAPEIIEKLVQAIVENLPQIIDCALELVLALTNGIVENFPEILDCAIELIETLAKALIDNLPAIIDAGKDILNSLIDGVKELFGDLKELGVDVVNKVKEGISSMIEKAKDWGKDMIDNFIGGIKEKWENLKKSVSDVAQSVKDLLGFSEPKEGPLSNFHTYAPDMMDLYSEGIRDNTKKVTSQLEKSMSSVKDIFTSGMEIPQEASYAPQGAGTGTNIYNITVTAGTIGSDYDARRAAQIMAEELGAIKSFQNLAVGGR